MRQMHSYKNTSSGMEHGTHEHGHKRLPIGENKAHVPPAGASNSYEKVRDKIDAHDNKHLKIRPYTKEKMGNR